MLHAKDLLKLASVNLQNCAMLYLGHYSLDRAEVGQKLPNSHFQELLKHEVICHYWAFILIIGHYHYW